jgi:hypothetical protein
MTGGDVVPGETPEPLDTATADLGHLRELLLAAGGGNANVNEVEESVRDYLGTHGPAIRDAATAVTEELRVQTLAELYKWRDQLNTQLQAGTHTPSSPPKPAKTGETSIATPTHDAETEQGPKGTEPST